ncbi:MAG TPA: hypothetical protein VGS79_00985 [Puia sp.]|nr:hypothetical protein [Puia sp.]
MEEFPTAVDGSYLDEYQLYISKIAGNFGRSLILVFSFVGQIIRSSGGNVP